MGGVRASKLRMSGVLMGLAVLIASVVAPIPASADVSSRDCATVDAVFARGSGQTTGSSGEANRFRDQLAARVKAPLTVNYYELGSESVDGHQYPAVAVGTGSWDSVTNSSGAFFSGGGAFQYGDSVDAGVDELDAYIEKRIAKCPSTLFILGGYSQGAQVVGETYVERLNTTERGKIVFSALFGDPKLYLPEGESVLWWDAPACKGQELSEWRRIVPECDTDNGSLRARKPYLPSSWTDSSGLWCADHDYVCGSSKAVSDTSGHGTYAAASGDVDKGVKEAVERLQERLPDEDDDLLDVSFQYFQSGATGLDVVFVIDSTGSMAGQIDQAKAIAGSLSTFVAANRGRVALVEYRDHGDEFTARVLSPLQEDTAPFSAALSGIAVGGGGDTPEALLHALMTGFNGLDWRPGATKAAIVLTDADYHDPDLVDGSTLPQVAARSLEIDPVNVYPVVPDYMVDYYRPLAEATTGEVVLNSGDAGPALQEALTKIESRPVPLLVMNGYHGSTGSNIRFDATPSYSASSTIVQWDWDFNGDGDYEVLDGEPIAEHQYNEVFDGYVQLRVTDADGLVANISAPVNIGPPPPLSTQPAESVAVEGAGSTATVTWIAAASPSKAWSLTVDGTHVGLVEPAARSAVITDVERDATVEFGVTPLSSADELGETRVAYLGPGVEPTPSPTPTTTPTSTPSSTPQPTATAVPSGSLTLSASTVKPGESLNVTGSGFAASAEVEIWLHSTPVRLGASTADLDGSFSLAVTIPKSTEPGSHKIVATVGADSSSATLIVSDATGSPLAVTGGTFLGWTLGLGALLVGLGSLVVLWAVRRRHTRTNA